MQHKRILGAGALLPLLLAFSKRRGDVAPAPKDIRALFDALEKQGKFQGALNNLLAQWGPKNRNYVSAQFLPPRLVDKNSDTIDRVNWRGVAAEDKTRHSAVVLVDSGEVFGSISYTLGDSGLGRQLTSSDYDGIVRYLRNNLPLQAAGVAMGLFESMLVQGLVEHDELANCDAIVTGGLTRRGSNGYFEYQNGPNLTNHRIMAGHDFSDPAYNPWPDIEARIMVLTQKSFVKSGIRGITTDQVRTILEANPYTALRVGKGNLVTNTDGTVRTTPISGVVTDEDLDNAFKGLGVQVPVSHDLRVPTRTGERRAFEEGALAFIAATGQTEQVVYNQNAADVPLQVDDTIGFSAIGVANAQTAPGRRSATRIFDNQSDARVEFEGWQTTGPIINIPEAISVIRGIE